MSVSDDDMMEADGDDYDVRFNEYILQHVDQLVCFVYNICLCSLCLDSFHIIIIKLCYDYIRIVIEFCYLYTQI